MRTEALPGDHAPWPKSLRYPADSGRPADPAGGVRFPERGPTLQNLIDRIRSRKLRAEVVQVVASRLPNRSHRPGLSSTHSRMALAKYHARSNAEFSASVFSTRSAIAGRSLVILAGLPVVAAQFHVIITAGE